MSRYLKREIGEYVSKYLNNTPGITKKNYINKYNIHLNNINDGDGDLYNFDNITSFMESVKNGSDSYNCCDFITADGGFDFSENFNEQEKDFIIFLICEI